MNLIFTIGSVESCLINILHETFERKKNLYIHNLIFFFNYLTFFIKHKLNNRTKKTKNKTKLLQKN